MGRKVQIRVSFLADSRFLTRLIEAVEKDPYVIAKDKGQIIYHLKEASLLLMKQTRPAAVGG